MAHLDTLCLQMDLMMHPVRFLNLLQTEANLDLNVEAVLAQHDWFLNLDLAHYWFQFEGVPWIELWIAVVLTPTPVF